MSIMLLDTVGFSSIYFVSSGLFERESGQYSWAVIIGVHYQYNKQKTYGRSYFIDFIRLWTHPEEKKDQ